MASSRLKETFATTYNDDFLDSDHYHRILFNSGRALQARELTQMQTIVQKEIERFGSNIFDAGACVIPGGANVDNRYNFIKLDTSSNTLPTDYATSVVGTKFTSTIPSGTINFTVIEVVEATGSDPATLYVSYNGGDSGSITDLAVSAGENMTNGSVTLTVQSTNTVTNPATGFGTRVMTGEGTYFVFGHFVFSPASQIIVSKYTDDYTGVVGFKAEENIITAADNSALYDNTGSTPNVTSPGADRYQITMTLIDEADIVAGDTFVWAARIVNGSLEDRPTGSDDYNKIEEVLATRTKEESGDYIARPFKLSFKPNSTDATKIDYEVSAGTAYVNGYRANKGSSTIVPVSKSTTTETINNDVVGANYGNYFLVSDIKGTPDINTFEQWNLRSAVDYGGSTVGTARVRHVERTGSTYKYYLMDINMSGSNNLRNTKSIGTDSANYANFTLINGKNEPQDTFNNNLLFPLSRIRPDVMADISLTFQKSFSDTTNTNDSAQLDVLTGTERWADTNLWTVTFDSAGEDVSTSAVITGAGTRFANLTNVGSFGEAKNITVLAYVTDTNASVRAKTMNTTTVTDTVDSDGNGVRFVDLGKADIFDVLAVRKDNASGADYSSLFTLDNGQRDNFYTEGRLILNNNFSVPSGSVYVQFRYFSHEPGSFFSINSYEGPITANQMSYADIPTYRQSNGEVINLSDVLDFRSTKDETGSNFTGTGAAVNFLPRPTDTISADITYYEPRRDKVIITEDNVVQVLEGEPDFNPQYPITPDNALELFKVDLNANTLNDSDLTVTKSSHRRYTMKDIDDLNTRLENLRETTALSLLELDTKNLNVVDSNGALRTKAGFLVDNFKDYLFSDTEAAEYRATIDVVENVLRPQEVLNDARLQFDSADANSTNFSKNNDILTLDYTETEYINQPVASRVENVNPFSVRKVDGRLTISPTSDVFYETQYAPAIYVTGATIRRNNQPGRNNFTISTVVSDVVLEDQTGEIPYMRSRKIYFRADRLKPNQQMFAFFNEVPVADWVREEDFKTITQDEEVYGNTLTNATGHPEGASTLTTDAFGTVEGSFVLPSTEALKFTTGTKDFELLNVSAYDPNAATASSRHQFISEGYIETRQQTIVNQRVIIERDGGGDGQDGPDPLAQTFIVEENDGVFVTGVSVYFASKATDNEVIYTELRPVVNGIPSATQTIPGSVVVKQPSEVTLVASATEAGVLAAPTKFTYQNPIYLNGGTEYAIVLSSNSTEYTVYTAKTDEFVIGSTEKRVNKQPSTGSLFKSSNMRTWTPTQDQDLTFKLDRAEFVSSGSVLLENVNNANYLLEKDPFFFDSGDTTVRVFQPGHGFRENDTVHFYGLDSATTYGGVLGTSILDSDRPIIKYDATGYTFAVDSAATSTTRAGGSNVTVNNNIQFDQFVPRIQTVIPSNTNLKASAKFTTGQSIAGSETRFQKDATFAPIKLNEINYRTAPGLIASASQEAAELSDKSVDIKLELSTTNTKLSPVIDLHRSDLITTTFVIDKQVDSDEYQALLLTDVGPSGENVPITYVAETAPLQGSHAAKHITKPVSLAAAASGLKILIAANRPSQSELEVYYRTALSDQVLADQSYVLLEQEESVPSDENREIFREYTYLAGGDNGSLDPFEEFQVKVVFRSTNSSKVPSIRDLRVIALVD